MTVDQLRHIKEALKPANELVLARVPKDQIADYEAAGWRRWGKGDDPEAIIMGKMCERVGDD